MSVGNPTFPLPQKREDENSPEQKREAAIEKIRQSTLMIVEDKEGLLGLIQEEFRKIGKTDAFVASSHEQALIHFDQFLSQSNNTIFVILDQDILWYEGDQLGATEAGMQVFKDIQEKVSKSNQSRLENGQSAIKLEVVFNSSSLPDKERAKNEFTRAGIPVAEIEDVGFSPKKEAAAESLIKHIIDKKLV
jgi:ribosomal protein S11